MRNTDNRYILEPYRGAQTRHTCPSCGHKGEFTFYIDTWNNNKPIHETCGRCNREKCGYHLPPSEYYKLAGKPSERIPIQHQRTPPKEKPISYLPSTLLVHDRHREENNLFRFMAKEFGVDAASKAFDLYHVSTSKHWRNDNGLSTTFPQIDELGRIHQLKVMAYNPYSGKRMKKHNHCELWIKERQSYVPDTREMDRIWFCGKTLIKNNDANFQQCFFGQHLIHNAQQIGIIESEKTALICSVLMPDTTWLATGGCNGCKWTETSVFAPLIGKRVVLFPDSGMLFKWQEKADILRKGGVHITVSRMCEGLSDNTDIADVLLQEKRAKESLTAGEFLQYAVEAGVINRVHYNV